MPINKELLAQFCSQDDNKPHMQEPWSEDNSSYATDGHVIVCTNRLTDVKENENAPKNISNAVFKLLFAQASNFVSIHSSFCQQVSQLPNYTACSTCQGSGSCSCHACNNDHNCGECQGIGAKPTTLLAFGRTFKVKQLQLILALPNLNWDLTVDDARIPFKFTGGSGIIVAQTNKESIPNV